MVPPEMPHLLLRFCQHVASGMEYLARKAFVHRDLAARNILVAQDKSCKVYEMENGSTWDPGGFCPLQRGCPLSEVNYKSTCPLLGGLSISVVEAEPVTHPLLSLQIADFGMARDLENEQYYVSHGGQVPVKWTAPEV